ncbi:MAG: AAA family ATPase [Desulfobacteraceae bacterium]|nr:AAA family ATPase [Desulfobacteraceae bacterium]
MKLKKALDKARQERSSITLLKKDKSSKKKTSSWEKPVYATSKICRIDREFVQQNRGVCIHPEAPEIEYYKILRTRIQHMAKKRKLQTIMITSPNRHEGKTVTSINMGFVFAKELHQTVLLVDCDFTGQDIHKYLGIENEFSLIDYFLNDVPINQLMIWPDIDKLTLISGNRTVVNASELLSSEMMGNLVEEMGSRYDDRFVFFDAPPVLERSEALSMAPMMDGILMVVEAGVTSKSDVEKAVDLLPQDKFLGFVLNKKA